MSRRHAGTIRRRSSQGGLAAIRGEALGRAGEQLTSCQPDHAVEEPAFGGAAGVSGKPRQFGSELVDVKTLHAKIGALALENDFLEGRSPRRDC